MTSLRNMLPAPSMKYHPDCFLAHSEQGSDRLHGDDKGNVHRPDCNNLFVRKFCAPLGFSMNSPKPSLFNRVIHILPVCSNKQMVRIAARSVVAVVTTLKTLWDRTLRVLPRHSMSDLDNSSPFGRVLSESPVAVVRFVSYPWPTFSGMSLFDVSPKPNLGCGFTDHKGTHIRISSTPLQ